jgi:hypothetical protein
LGYGRRTHSLEAFLGSRGSSTSPVSAPHRVSPWCAADLPTARATPLPRDYHRPGWTTFLRHPIACLLPARVPARPPLGPKTSRGLWWLASLASARARAHRYGNINPLSIDYACRPRLRSRLTQGGLAWPWNPWSSGGGVSHSSFATHACILTRVASTARSPGRFSRDTTLPYPPTPLHPTPKGGGRGSMCECHGFGGVLEPRYIIGAESLDQ